LCENENFLKKVKGIFKVKNPNSKMLQNQGNADLTGISAN